MTAWVLGGTGLLGAALGRVLGRAGTPLFVPSERLCWDGGPVLARQMAAAIRAFSEQADAVEPWAIYWAAGVGTMNSAEAALAQETATLAMFLGLLGANARLMALPGVVAFASSAGAIYAGTMDDIITERSVPMPTTAYAREKLLQEDLLKSFMGADGRPSVLIARITTLFGPGQAAAKQQGLLSHIARSILRNRPISIYVPYDTIRDYLFADDAAAILVAASRRTGAERGCCTKIIASQRPTTIAEIISIFRKIARRPPRIVISANRMTTLYARRVQFRSEVFPETSAAAPTPLHIGIADLLREERATYSQSPRPKLGLENDEFIQKV